ncbi:MAG TPA: hypothetical protein VFT98_19875 [Myxococcota bacterium]|nr:hypothetical protein [Myxococcota bacterium]
MKKQRDDELRREPPAREAEAESTAEAEIDVAESRWDPWLIALARMEIEEEQREPRVN